jgi:Ca2+-binding RTX toxin-like protein
MLRRHGPRRCTPFVLAAALGALTLPGTAFGSTASVSGATLTVQAAGGEQNDIVVETAAPVFRVIDNTVPLTAGAGCNQRSVHRVNCPTAGITLVRVLAGDGDDTVQTLIGTTAADLQGGTGTDSLTGSDGNDTLQSGRGGSGFSEQLFGMGGQDTLIGGPALNGSVAMNGGDDGDQLLGGFSADQLLGGPGPDLLQGGSGGDYLFYPGSAGVTITAGVGANDGEPGENDFVAADIETFFGTGFNDNFTGGPLPEYFNMSSGNDVVNGGGGADNIYGGDNADTLSGEEGDDFIQGGKRADDISGGSGMDIADFNDHPAAVSVTINNVANDGSGGGAEGDNVHTDVENLRGTDLNDLLIGSAQDNLILGDEGSDNIQGAGGDDELYGEVQFGSPPGAGNDDLGGGDGDDTLFGGAGADDFSGGPDYDFVDYSGGFGIGPELTITIDNIADDGAAAEGDNVMDTVEGVIGGSSDDTITGSSQANTLFGGFGDDTLHGANGPDVLDGETAGFFGGFFGADTLDGGGGNDTVTYRSHGFTGVTVDIGGGADGASLGAEGDDVQSTVENLIGSDNADQLTGNDQANSIAGRDGTDTLIGGAGPDHLAGNLGSDTHEGEAGGDEINSRGDNVTDTDNCGSESDVVIRDPIDTINNCETVFQ